MYNNVKALWARSTVKALGGALSGTKQESKNSLN
jgi:hypothetical protein